MMPSTPRLPFAVAGLALLLSACASDPPMRFYSMAPALAAPAAATTSAPMNRRIVVGPVSVPESIHRVEIVVRRGDHGLQLLEFERWAALPNSEIAHATAQALQAALADGGTRVMVDAPTIGPPAIQRVTIEVQRFDALLGQSLAFEATWRVLDARGTLLAGGQSRSLESAPGGAEGIAAAAGRAIGRMAGEIAAGLPAAAR